ncbi:MAG: zinc-dependent peptidase [Saprospiraceae bacterium]|nr:zinc-dependent peptidase [Saprospiraceae bacterium]
MTIAAVIAITSGYFYFTEYIDLLAVPMAIGLLVTILAYVFQHQVNWWWYRRRPPRLPAAIDALYRKVSPWYDKLPREAANIFRARVALFVESKEFIVQGIDSMPEDLKYMVAFYGIRLTMHQKDFLFRDYDRVVFYLHPFLTPNHPEQVHTCEVEHEDGTIILAIEQLTTSFLSPRSYYAVGMHGMAEAFRAKYAPYVPDMGDEIWATLERISGISQAKINDFIGLEQADPWPVVVHHWFVYPRKFLQQAPDLYRRMQTIFSSDDAEGVS